MSDYIYQALTAQDREALRLQRLRQAEKDLNDAAFAAEVARVNAQAARDLIALLTAQTPQPQE